jgi:DNA-binding NarL/FixJ family response regulator
LKLEDTVSSDSSPKAMKKFRILIVDDTDTFRQILKTTLQVSFPTIAIHEAADGGEALREVDAFLPDLIFMDIKLPGVNGLELTRKIKAAHPNITIFILTSYDIPEYQEAAFQYGADRFLPKTSLNPVELEELVKSCQKV